MPKLRPNTTILGVTQLALILEKAVNTLSDHGSPSGWYTEHAC